MSPEPHHRSRRHDFKRMALRRDRRFRRQRPHDILVNDDGKVSIWDNGQMANAHIIAAAGTISNGLAFRQHRRLRLQRPQRYAAGQ